MKPLDAAELDAVRAAVLARIDAGVDDEERNALVRALPRLDATVRVRAAMAALEAAQGDGARRTQTASAGLFTSVETMRWVLGEGPHPYAELLDRPDELAWVKTDSHRWEATAPDGGVWVIVRQGRRYLLFKPGQHHHIRDVETLAVARFLGSADAFNRPVSIADVTAVRRGGTRSR